jgi:hypothetical protein
VRQRKLPETTTVAPNGSITADENDNPMSHHTLHLMSFPDLNSTAQSDELESTEQVSDVIDLTNGTSGTDDDTNLEVVIGSVMSNGRFKCSMQECHRLSFGRKAELERHYGAHTKKLAYWCEIAGCPRSKEVGYRPFPRKDKLRSHVCKVHGGVA